MAQDNNDKIGIRFIIKMKRKEEKRREKESDGEKRRERERKKGENEGVCVFDGFKDVLHNVSGSLGRFSRLPFGILKGLFTIFLSIVQISYFG